MKRDFLVFLVLLVLATGSSAWCSCSQDTVDHGICDTMYVEPWPGDSLGAPQVGSGPYLVRVPIYVTHDVPADIDSIAGFAFPLCYTKATNTAKYCSLSTYWNTSTFTGGSSARSIFRHIVSGTDTLHNWMMDLAQQDPPVQWAFITLYVKTDIVNADSNYFRLLLASSVEPLMGIVNKRLLATMTFRVEDTMHVCIDTCFWPPQTSLLWSLVGGEKTYVPRLGNQKYSSYKVCSKFPVVTSDVREIQGSDEVRPSGFSLSQNYPNPFNPTTNFQFTLAKSAQVRIDIFNIVGQKVKTLVDEEMKAGVYKADWDGKDEKGTPVSSGIYFYRMRAGDFSNMKKMVLLK